VDRLKIGILIDIAKHFLSGKDIYHLLPADPFFMNTLENDHDEVKAILDKLENTSKTAKKTKEDLFLKLKRHLIPHMKGEEKHLYPALLSFDPSEFNPRVSCLFYSRES
jgi:hypothetical protein